MTVLVLGPRGTFSEAVAKSRYCDEKILLVPTLEEIYRMLKCGEAKRAIVPLRNSISGEIASTKEYLCQENPKIVWETSQNIEYDLIGNTSLGLADLLYAHPHAYRQCQRVLPNYLRFVESNSNTHAAEMLHQNPQKKALAIVPHGLYDFPLVRSITLGEPSITVFIEIERLD